MSLIGTLGVATTGLDSIAKQLAVVSQNVANAGTAGYTRETVAVQDAGQSGVILGVRTGPAARSLDLALQDRLRDVSAGVAGGKARADALAGLDAASGTPGAGFDLPSLLGTLRTGLSTLASDPANGTQQRAVLAAADGLARGFNALGSAVTGARQAAQDAVAADADTANAALRGIGTLSDQIIAAQARGDSTAGLEDARDSQVQVVADLTGARFLRQSNGDMLAVAGGVLLPLRGGSGPLVIQAATLAPNTPLAAVPRVTVGGVDVTGSLTGGRIGANLALRDTVLPAVQAGLDGLAAGVASGFAAAGVALFTDPTGAVPAGAGTAGVIQVSAAVRAAPTQLRDGTGPAGAAGSTTVIDAVLDGPLASGAGSLASQASSFTADIAGDAAAASATVQVDTAAQTSLQAKLAAGSGVSVDSELATLVRLQGAYAANAKVLGGCGLLVADPAGQREVGCRAPSPDMGCCKPWPGTAQPSAASSPSPRSRPRRARWRTPTPAWVRAPGCPWTCARRSRGCRAGAPTSTAPRPGWA